MTPRIMDATRTLMAIAGTGREVAPAQLALAVLGYTEDEVAAAIAAWREWKQEYRAIRRRRTRKGAAPE